MALNVFIDILCFALFFFFFVIITPFLLRYASQKKIDWHRSKCLQFSGATHFCDDHQQSIQGQLLLQVFAMNSESPCISHGQLYYVACLRVGKPSDLFAYAPEGRTKNIVFPNALQ